MNNLDNFFYNGKEYFVNKYLEYSKNLIDNVNKDEIRIFIEQLIEARQSNSNIFFMGNGGSASTASHFANDIAIGTKSLSKPFKCISLNDNQAILTAIANDYGYEHIFTKQLSVLAKENDYIVVITASGNSVNIINALKYAKNKKCKSISITGFDGGICKDLADYNIHIKTEKGEYGPVEDLHMLLAGLIGSYLIRHIREENKNNKI